MELAIRQTDPAVADGSSISSPADSSQAFPTCPKTDVTGDAKLDMPNETSSMESCDTEQKELCYDVPLKNHPLHLTIDTLHDDDDPWLIEWMMFNIFEAYLQPGSEISVDEASQLLDSILPENRPDTSDDPDDDKEQVAGFMLELCDLIFKIAKQIPYDHESQPKFVELMKKLKHLPITETSYQEYFSKAVPIWQDPNWIGWDDSIRHALCGPSSVPQKGKTSQQEWAEYVNVEAFAARVEAARIFVPQHLYAFSAICTGLNPDRARRWMRIKPEDEPFLINVGAQWMIRAGDWWWSEIRWGWETVVGHISPDRSETNLNLSPSTWVEWMRGFHDIDTDDTEARIWAHRAAKKMEDIMIAHGYTAQKMEEWDPEIDNIHSKIWDDPRFAHLLKAPEKTAKAGVEAPEKAKAREKVEAREKIEVREKIEAPEKVEACKKVEACNKFAKRLTEWWQRIAGARRHRSK